MRMRSNLLDLLERLEEAIATAPTLPVGGRILASRDELLDLIDAIRGELPDALMDAERIVRERARIVADADAEAERIVQRARDQGAYLVQEHTVLKSAELEAERILNRAREDASQVTASAEHYSLELFTRLEEEALRLAADIRKAAARKP
jgi:vacuolar-type H+-ATPase subunit H